MDFFVIFAHLPDPRMIKRIHMLAEMGNTGAMFWDRGVKCGQENSIGQGVKVVRFSDKGEEGNPLKRIWPTCLVIGKMVKEAKRLRPSCIYVSGYEAFLAACLSTLGRKHKPYIIYEVCDLHYLLIEKQKRWFPWLVSHGLRFLERLMCKRAGMLVITSPPFYDVYYRSLFPKENVFFMPNMPDLKSFAGYRKKVGGIFTIGFIGAIRYIGQMKMMVDAAQEAGIRVLIAGRGAQEQGMIDYVKDKPHVTYDGAYVYEQDIAVLYGRVDCIYSVYDATDRNVRLALPNRLYEAVYCEIPLIVAKHTYLAQTVKKMGVGIAVEIGDKKELVEAMQKLSRDRSFYDRLVSHCVGQKATVDGLAYQERLQTKIRAGWKEKG